MNNIGRACCCGGCFANDSCPLPFAYPGDFIYELEIANDDVDGTFAQSRVLEFGIKSDDVQCLPMTWESIGGYVCPTNYPDCDNGGVIPRTDTWEFTGQLPPRVIMTVEQHPCYVTCPEGPGVNVTARKRCPASKWSKVWEFDYSNCSNCPGPCGISFLDCAIVENNFIYATYYDGGPPCGDYEARVDPAGVMGALSRGKGKVQFSRVGQTQFDGALISGAGVSEFVYLHRANICYGESADDCGDCSYAHGFLPCIQGVCCCRAVLSFKWEISRPISYYAWAYDGSIGDYVYQLQAAPDCVQQVQLYYEGPVDSNLYGVAGSPTVREFRLLAGKIIQASGQPITNSIGLFGHDACLPDLFPGMGYTVVNGLPPVAEGTTINYSCTPCKDELVGPDLLTAPQLVALGINETINISRVIL